MRDKRSSPVRANALALALADVQLFLLGLVNGMSNSHVRCAQLCNRRFYDFLNCSSKSPTIRFLPLHNGTNETMWTTTWRYIYVSECRKCFAQFSYIIHMIIGMDVEQSSIHTIKIEETSKKPTTKKSTSVKRRRNGWQIRCTDRLIRSEEMTNLNGAHGEMQRKHLLTSHNVSAHIRYWYQSRQLVWFVCVPDGKYTL